MEIYLIRHTTPDIAQGVCYGYSDIPLADSFAKELSATLKELPLSFDAVYTSPLRRCTKLAMSLKYRELFKMDERLKEMNFGDWELKPWDDIDRKDFDAWADDYVNNFVPNGECVIDLSRRVIRVFEEIKKMPFERVAIVCHAGAIRSILSHHHDKPLKDMFDFKVGYGEVIKIEL